MAQLGGVRDLKASEAYLERNLLHWETYGFGLWLLRRNDASEIIGRACLRHLLIDEVDEVELGYGFYPAHWGQGLATEIAQACVATGFERLDCGSLIALTRPTNAASQRVMSKVGLTFERHVQLENEPHVLYRRRRG